MRLRWKMAVGAGSILASATAAYILWLPDVSFLALENPRSTAYIEHYVKRSVRQGRKPAVFMRWVPLSHISPHLAHAVVIAEDDMFYRHGGVDWESLQKAFDYNLRRGRFARGASTITQQTARNLFLSPSRNPLRKIKETLIAWKLERALTKDRILEIYLNIAEWGVGIYGVQAASRAYFGKDASQINPEEAAALAAALPSPWRWNPLREAGPKMLRRREVLLERMQRAGYLPGGDLAEVARVDMSTTPVRPSPRRPAAEQYRSLDP